MSQFPSQPPASPSHLPPPIPPAPSIQVIPTGQFPNGPVGGPLIPYQPATFSALYLWWAILFGAGIPLCLLLVGIPMLMAAAVLKFITLFKSWNQIQDGHQRTSPSMAVGFCFIPIFHFYWVFVAVRGLAEDMNAYLRRYNIPAPLVSEGLALALCISSVALLPMLFIPIINIAAGIGVIVLAYIFWYQIRIANMAIAHAKLTAAAQAGTLRAT